MGRQEVTLCREERTVTQAVIITGGGLEMLTCLLLSTIAANIQG